ncbi:MAG: phosphotransferase [Chthonomonadales bacterium]
MLTQASIPSWYRATEILSADYSLASFRAWDLRSGEEVVLHVFRQGHAAGTAAGIADTLGRLHNLPVAGVAPVRDAGTYNGCAYTARAFVPGEPLEARLLRGPVLSPREAVQIYSAVSSALTRLHERSINHGSLTCRNVILASRGGIVVTDPLIRRTAARFALGNTPCRWEDPASLQSDEAALLRLRAELAAAAMRWPLNREELPRNEMPPAQLFQMVWRPAAIIGLCAGLGTVTGLANPEPPLAAAAHPTAEVQKVRATAMNREAAPGERLVHLRGLEAALLPEVAGYLNLTNGQRDALQQILEESRRQVTVLVESAAATEGTVPPLLMRAVRERSEAHFMDTLTSAQQSRWRLLRLSPPQR